LSTSIKRALAQLGMVHTVLKSCHSWLVIFIFKAKHRGSSL